MRVFLKKAVFSALLILLPGIAIVQAKDDDVLGDGLGDQFGFVPRKSWDEATIPIPDLPAESDLLRVKIFEMPHYKYYIDAKSLHVSAGDNVARYLMIVEPPSGLRNMFYEGIRCDTREYKIYASSLWGQPLSPIRGPQWYKIADKGLTVYRYDLFKYFLCSNSIIKGKKKDILHAIEYPPDNFIEEELE